MGKRNEWQSIIRDKEEELEIINNKEIALPVERYSVIWKWI